jgi:hypothetical protein
MRGFLHHGTVPGKGVMLAQVMRTLQLQGQVAIQAGTIPTYRTMNLILSPHVRETEENRMTKGFIPGGMKAILNEVQNAMEGERFLCHTLHKTHTKVNTSNTRPIPEVTLHSLQGAKEVALGLEQSPIHHRG